MARHDHRHEQIVNDFLQDEFWRRTGA